jgi:hypothetical protein
LYVCLGCSSYFDVLSNGQGISLMAPFRPRSVASAPPIRFVRPNIGIQVLVSVSQQLKAQNARGLALGGKPGGESPVAVRLSAVSSVCQCQTAGNGSGWPVLQVACAPRPVVGKPHAGLQQTFNPHTLAPARAIAFSIFVTHCRPLSPAEPKLVDRPEQRHSSKSARGRVESDAALSCL